MKETPSSPSWPEAPELTIDPVEESLRLEELLSLSFIGTHAESRFDRITRLAARFFHVPVAYVAFIDEKRQWLKSAVGVCPPESPRSMTFCQYTILGEKPLVIPDAQQHPIGRNHPFVVGEPHVRFYAGVPLHGPKGRKIGTFCIVDTEPREFSESDVASLVEFATLIEREINLGEIIESQGELLKTRQQLVETQRRLDHEFADAAKYVRLMLPPPLAGEEIVDWEFHPSTKLGGDGLGYRRINDDLLALYILDVTGHGLGSALLAVTALELLRNPMAQVNFAKPAVVIDRLNRTFQMKNHAGKFFSVWYGVYSRSARTITYANAGHPPALLLTKGTGAPTLTRTESCTSVLGIMPTIEIPEITIPFGTDTELYLFTDGLYELFDQKGGRISYDEFVTFLDQQVKAGQPAWDSILTWLKRSHESKLIDDDVSLMRFATKG